MNIMKFVKVAEKSAHAFRTAVNRIDIQYKKTWNTWEARVWMEKPIIIDIVEVNDIKQLFDIPRGEYEVHLLDDHYKTVKVYDQEGWIDYMIKTDLDNLESEEDEFYDSMEDWREI